MFAMQSPLRTKWKINNDEFFYGIAHLHQTPCTPGPVDDAVENIRF